MSEDILNSTSTRLGYTVSFTVVHAGRYRTEDKLKIQTIQNTETKHNPQKADNAKYSKTKLAWFSCQLWHSARKQSVFILQEIQSNPSPRRQLEGTKSLLWRVSMNTMSYSSHSQQTQTTSYHFTYCVFSISAKHSSENCYRALQFGTQTACQWLDDVAGQSWADRSSQATERNLQHKQLDDYNITWTFSWLCNE